MYTVKNGKLVFEETRFSKCVTCGRTRKSDSAIGSKSTTKKYDEYLCSACSQKEEQERRRTIPVCSMCGRTGDKEKELAFFDEESMTYYCGCCGWD